MGLHGQTLFGAFATLWEEHNGWGFPPKWPTKESADAFVVEIEDHCGREPQVVDCAGSCCASRRKEEEIIHAEWMARAKAHLAEIRSMTQPPALLDAGAGRGNDAGP